MTFFLFIHWDLNPEIGSIGGFALRYYSLLFAGGIAAAYLLLKKVFRKEHLSLYLLDRLTLYVIFGAIAGARLGHCLFYEPGYYFAHPWEIILPWTGMPGTPGFRFTGYQGLASHGGAIGIVLAILLFCGKYKMSFLMVMDKLALVVPLSGAFIRTGNLFNSEIIGRPTSVPYAFIFERVDQVPRHPAQVYEALAYTVLFLLLYYVIRWHARTKRDGYLFGWFLVLLFSARFLLEYLKENQEPFERYLVFDMGQILSIPFILCWLVLVISSNYNKS